MIKKVELSICIAAYNNNKSLERALNSIKTQSIASELDVLISDDFSPIEIDTNHFKKFKKYFNSFKIIRQPINLGVLSNAEWLFNNIETDLYTFLQHDDVVIDKNFYERAIQCFKNNEEIMFYYGNSLVLNSKSYASLNHKEQIKNYKTMYDPYAKSLIGIRNDNSISGFDFINNFLNQNASFITAWSAVVFRRKKSLLVGGFGGTYTLSKSEASLLNIYREEEGGFIYLMLSLLGDCQLESIPSVIRILEPTSFSTIRKHPARLMLQDGALFAYYKLASFIELNLNNYEIDHIIKLIFQVISKYPLEYENKITKEFFNKYKLKNKKYESIISKALENSSKLKTKFKLLKLIKRYLDYHFGLYQKLKLIKRMLAHIKNILF